MGPSNMACTIQVGTFYYPKLRSSDAVATYLVLSQLVPERLAECSYERSYASRAPVP